MKKLIANWIVKLYESWGVIGNFCCFVGCMSFVCVVLCSMFPDFIQGVSFGVFIKHTILNFIICFTIIGLSIGVVYFLGNAYTHIEEWLSDWCDRIYLWAKDAKERK